MTETAYFGGGCFWCTEAIFKRLNGVVSVISGYAGGTVENPTYEQVSTGLTQHAESVKIEFDPKVITYDQLLEIFWAIHDPTTLNQQGGDVGTQYRSVIFYINEEQKRAAKSSKKDSYVTQILPFSNFYTAEEYHQNFYEKQPDYPYCTLIIKPKVIKLLEKFGGLVKENYRKA